MCDDEDIKDSPYMAFIQPATGDYNPDLVNTLTLLLPLLPMAERNGLDLRAEVALSEHPGCWESNGPL